MKNKTIINNKYKNMTNIIFVQQETYFSWTQYDFDNEYFIPEYKYKSYMSLVST